MATTQQPHTPIIKVDEQQLDATLFERLGQLTVDVRLDRTGVTTLQFADPGYELFDSDPAVGRVGAKISVALPGSQRTPVEVFVGTVTGVGVEQSEDGAIPTIVVEARGNDHVLARTTKIHSYVEMTRKDMLASLVAEHGWRLDYTGTDGDIKFPYMLRTGTDAEFLDMLARPDGYEWFVRDNTLVFRDRQDQDGPTLHADRGMLRFSARYQAETTASNLTLHGWDVRTQQEVSGVAHLRHLATAEQLGSDADFVSTQQHSAFEAFDASLDVSTAAVADQKEATLTAEGFAKRMLRSAVRAEGLTLATPEIVVGSFVKIEGVGERLGGRYFVTRVVHEFTPGQETRTRFFCDPSTAVASGEGARPGMAGPGEDASGGGAGHPSYPATGPLGGFGRNHLVIGQVTNINDPEKLGRVRVKFPGLGGGDESAWARPVLPGAGSQRGLDLRPEIDDEVIVAFAQGDPRMPLVLGGVYSGARKPTYEETEHSVVTKRTLRTRVGHELVLSDGPGGKGTADRHVKVALADGKTSLLVGEDRIVVEAPSGNPISLKAGSTSLTITDGGDLEIKAKNVTINADANIKIAGMQVEAAAKATMKLDAKATFDAKGGASAKLEGGATTVVKGAIVQIN